MKNVLLILVFTIHIADMNSFAQETGKFEDFRDGQVYETVTFGSMVWMAENLNYYTSTGSWCYNNDSSYCSDYGRLYNWETAKNVCPAGWHLPSRSEMEKLFINPQGNSVYAYNSLKEAGWLGSETLQGGWMNNKFKFQDIGTAGRCWSSTAFNRGPEVYWFIQVQTVKSMGYVNLLSNKSDIALSVRCVQD